MIEDNGYSLISVDADEADDVVIQAGVTASVQPAGRAHDDSADGSASEGADVGVPAGPAGKDDGPLAGAADDREREEYLLHKRASEARRRAGEMVTTEEDLHAKMPFAKMQASIVVGLVLLIAAALVYWFLLR